MTPDHGSIVTGIAAGVGGAILALLGVDAPTLTAALAGSIIGAGAARPTSRWHGAALFAASVCASAESAAVLGPVLDHLTDTSLPMIDGAMAAKAVALATGALLHPIVQAASETAPAVVRGLARFLPGAGGQK